MRLPFTEAQFFEVLRRYNEAVWPAPLLLSALALAAILFVFRPRAWSGALVSGILAVFWTGLAIAYHLAFFTRINPIARVFAALSAAGAATFVCFGLVGSRLHDRPLRPGWTVAGLILVTYALAVYPVASIVTGHPYPAMPTFGLPCPTTLFTIGVLAFLVPPYPWVVIVVPVLWSVVGLQAAFLLGVPQDLALLPAGAVGVVLIVRRSDTVMR